jgi:hypothetical protein
MKIKSILNIFFVLIILEACASPTETDFKINLQIEGVVIYSDTKKPVVNCHMEVMKYGGVGFDTFTISHTFTDEFGRYSFKCPIDKKDTLGGFPEINITINGVGIHQTKISHEVIRWTDDIQIIDIEIDPF